MKNKKRICPNCNKSYEYSLSIKSDGSCLHDLKVSQAKDPLSGRRKENRDMSIVAHQQAAAYSKDHPPTEMVDIPRPKGFKASQFGPAVAKVPKKTIDRIKESIKDITQE